MIKNQYASRQTIVLSDDGFIFLGSRGVCISVLNVCALTPPSASTSGSHALSSQLMHARAAFMRGCLDATHAVPDLDVWCLVIHARAVR